MKTTTQERLKDIIIDHVYSHCYDEILKTIEDEVASDKYQGDDPDLRKIYDTFIKTSGEVKIFNDIRRATHCRIIIDKAIETSLAEKLEAQGYSVNGSTTKKVESAVRFLVNRSYLIKKYPANSEYTLTTKGVEHYSSGRSFEELHIQGRYAKIALTFSIVSVAASAAAIAMNLNLI